MSQFYTVDYHKLSFREYWNLSPNWKGIVAWLMKVIGRPLQERNAYPHPSKLKDYQVGEQHLPSEAVAALHSARAEVERLGFLPPQWIYQPPVHGIVSLVCGTYVHTSGEVIARLMHTKATSGTIRIEHVTVVFLTPLKDGRVLVTSNMRPSFRGAPNILVHRRVGAPPATLYDAHMKWLKAPPAGGKIRRIPTKDECDAFIDQYENDAHEFNVRRGLYVPLTEEEATLRKEEQVSAEAALAAGERYPKVFAEIDRIQNKKTSWSSTLMLLALSIAAFVALGVFRWSWETVVILVGVLFFHELGHYIAMRLFKYQNLKMFFIPLFGAAVSGRNYNVKGWQKAIVSLAGPVPGIVVGGALAVFAIATEAPWASKVAIMALLLNGINLLPVLPLDGGWLMHTLLFCRRYWLEGAFHLLAGLIMVGYRIAGGENIFLFLGILMLFTSPMAFRLARVVHGLRSRGVSGVSRDQQTIPRETGEAIVDEIKASIPGGHNDKTLAGLTLQVFEKLNATPPSLGASLLLFAAYVAPMVAALLLGGALLVGRPGSLIKADPIVANREYACGTLQRSGQTTTVPSVVLISTFTNAAEAHTQFTQAINDLHGTFTLFGQSVFHATTNSTAVSTNYQVVAEYPASNDVATVVLTCRAATEAQAMALTNELQAYLDLATHFILVPPWISQPELSDEERSRQERTRQTYRQIQEIKSAAFRDPQYRKLSKQLFPAVRQKNTSKQRKLLKEMESFADESSRRKLTDLKMRGDQVDAALIDLYLREPSDAAGEQEYETWWRTVSESITSVTQTEPGLPGSSASWFAIRYGAIEREGVKLRFEPISFRRTDLGLPAFADFLCSRSCSDIRYTILGSGSEDY